MKSFPQVFSPRPAGFTFRNPSPAFRLGRKAPPLANTKSAATEKAVPSRRRSTELDRLNRESGGRIAERSRARPPQGQCAWAELPPSPASPPPLQVSREAAVPNPRPPSSQGDVRPLDRAPAPPLPAALGAHDSAVGAVPLRDTPATTSSVGIKALEWVIAAAGRQGEARPGGARSSAAAHLPDGPHRRGPSRACIRCPAGSRGTQPASAVHLCPSQPIARDYSGRTSRNL